MPHMYVRTIILQLTCGSPIEVKLLCKPTERCSRFLIDLWLALSVVRSMYQKPETVIRLSS